MKYFKANLSSFLYGFSFCLLSLFLLQQAIIFFNKKSNKEFKESPLSFQKIEDMYDLILNTYYEPIDTSLLLNSMLESMLKNMDQHTSYIPSMDHIRQNEEMMGNFFGIGIQFSIFQDTIVVIRVLPDGPSEKTELRAGDRITHVNGKKITGPTISSEDVLNRLRGAKGTEVELTILNFEKKTKNISLYRDEIPLNSIASSYVLENDIGYLKIDKFSATTYNEFIDHANKLMSEGAEKMIIDLRGNTGGYLDQAVAIADELLKIGLNIVSVKGNYRDEINYESTYQGQLSHYPLIILIDEGSASASEILAGAIQDNGRGEVVGRPSFGKGLVGEEFSLGDGSVLRLTVAKYFTPSGRCIQKEQKGNHSFNPDSLLELQDLYFNPIDSTKVFYTLDGDTVYGGGGIYPDFNIPAEFISLETSEFIYKNITKIDELTFQFIDNNRYKIKNGSSHFRDFFSINGDFLWNSVLDAFPENEFILNDLKDELYVQLEILSARNFLSTQEFIYFVNQEDQMLKKAVKLLKPENYEF
tara:strand:- start:2310 stop:3896 length:1587 start_codon:yes stop_codon:yes gene_type:complete